MAQQAFQVAQQRQVAFVLGIAFEAWDQKQAVARRRVAVAAAGERALQA